MIYYLYEEIKYFASDYLNKKLIHRLLREYKKKSFSRSSSRKNEPRNNNRLIRQSKLEIRVSRSHLINKTVRFIKNKNKRAEAFIIKNENELKNNKDEFIKTLFNDNNNEKSLNFEKLESDKKKNRLLNNKWILFFFCL